MSSLVVDASIAVKWFLPEAHAVRARRILRGRRTLLAPDLIWAEVGNTLWKKLGRAEITDEEAQALLRDFRRFPLRTYTAEALLDPAWELAVRFNVSIYDSLYLALGVSQDCPVATADRALRDALKGGPLAPLVLWVEDIR